jgi:hypothetical protein
MARVVSFGGSSVRIDARGEKGAELVDFLYRDLPSYEGPPPHVTLKVRAEPELQKLILRVGKAVYYRGDSFGRLASSLLSQTAFHLADKSQGGLLIHAAAVRGDGGCILFPGRTGAGKSTLTSWLMRKGFGYLTDELVYVPFGSKDVQPFARPLNIKQAGCAVLEPAIVDLDAPGVQVLRSPEIVLVPRGAWGQLDAIETSRLAAIVFPTFRAGAPCKFEAVPRAGVGIGLMGCLINARNLPGHGFGEVTHLARQVPGYTLEYGDFTQLETWVTSLKALGRATA